MAKVKAVNYTEAQIATMREMYQGVDNKAEVTAIATATGKTAASVRAKLAHLGLYKADKPAKATDERITKRSLAEAVGEELGLLEAEVDGLEKAPKSALEKILASLSA